MNNHFLPLLVATHLFFPWAAFAAALSTAFTYQGRLLDGGAPANGTYDVEFTLYSTATGGSAQGSSVVKEDVPVSSGLFSVEIDFGATAFSAGEARWLQIAVRAGSSSGAFTIFASRQSLSPTPFAHYASNAGSLNGNSAAFYQNAANLTSGTISAARLPASGLNAASLTTGKLAEERLPAGLPRLSAAENIFTGKVGIGTGPLAQLDVFSGADPDALTLGSTSESGTKLRLHSDGGTGFTDNTWSISTGSNLTFENPGRLQFRDEAANATRLTLDSVGSVGIGTSSPGDRLEVYGADAAIRIRNSNDAIGGVIGDTWGTLQLGMYNPGTTARGILPANTKRAFFGIEGATGKVGTLTNNFGQPSFRVTLDDGNGNMLFGSTTRQMLNLWDDNYGIGVQNNTLYQRSDANFAWYRGGTHSNSENDPGGGGTRLMSLDASGDLSYRNMPAVKSAQTARDPRQSNTDVELGPGQNRDFESISVVAPAPGSFLVFATLNAWMSNDGGQQGKLHLKLMDANTGHTFVEQSLFATYSGAGQYEHASGVISIVWNVSVTTAGTNYKFTINAFNDSSTSASCYSSSLHAIFIPRILN